MPRPTILHVTEVAGGGVPPVIEAIAKATPTLDHIYVALPLRQHPSAAELSEVRNIRLGRAGNPWRWVAEYNRVVRRYRPDYIHLHSSLAGLLGRIGIGPSRPPIIYTPHCLSSERTDLSSAVRWMHLTVERLLLRRTDAIYAISDHEADALAVAARRRRVEIVAGFNPTHWPDHPSPVRTRPGHLRIATVGRVTAQKDPDFFLKVLARVRDRSDLAVDWLWIGDGEPSSVDKLRQAGVRVTGWLSREGVTAELMETDVYVHTAAWEGFPVSFCEAIGLGLPLAVRLMPSLPGMFEPFAAADPSALADRLIMLSEDRARKEESLRSLSLAHKLDSSELSPLLLGLYQKRAQSEK